MADVKELKPETPREDYLYRQGFNDGYKAFRGLPNEEQIQRQLQVAADNARAQVSN